MKITKVTPIGLRFFPARPPQDGLGAIAARDVVLVEIETDEGISGIGECFALGNVRSTAVTVEEVLAPVLLGQDPTNVEGLWERMYRSSFRVGRRGLVLCAMSGVDIALWDITGKVAGLPVYKLLGGVTDRFTAYASGGYYMKDKSVRDLAAEMAGYAEAGFTAMKMKIGALSLGQDLERVRAARAAVGAGIDLAVDANNAWDFNTAVRACRTFEELDLFFFEEPLPSDDLDGSARLAAATTVPIAGYETEYTRWGMKEFIVRGAVDVAQTDAIWCGGISEARKIGILASAWGLPLIPHFSASAVSLCANLQVAASLSNVRHFELTLDENPLRDELNQAPVRVERGTIFAPEGPGIGMTLNRAVLERYRVL